MDNKCYFFLYFGVFFYSFSLASAHKWDWQLHIYRLTIKVHCYVSWMEKNPICNFFSYIYFIQAQADMPPLVTISLCPVFTSDCFLKNCTLLWVNMNEYETNCHKGNKCIAQGRPSDKMGVCHLVFYLFVFHEKLVFTNTKYHMNQERPEDDKSVYQVKEAYTLIQQANISSIKINSGNAKYINQYTTILILCTYILSTI